MFTNISVVKGKNTDKKLHDRYQNKIFSLIKQMDYIVGLNDENIKMINLDNITNNITFFNHITQKYEHDKIDIIGNFNNGSAKCTPILKFKHIDYTTPKPSAYYTPEILYDVNIYKISNIKNEEEYFYAIAYSIEDIRADNASCLRDISEYLLGHISNTDFSILYLLQESPIVISIRSITLPASLEKLYTYFPFIG